MAAQHLVHFQANENHRGFPGTGSTDWVAVCRALHEIGYKGPVSLEPFRRNDDRFGVPFAQWRPPHEDESERLAAQRGLHQIPSHTDGISAMTLKIGWIGCGIHATQMLLPQLVRHDVEIAALCDIDGKRLADAGRQFGVSRLTSDAEELIRTPGIDAVGMAVGPDQHLALRQACARSRPACLYGKAARQARRRARANFARRRSAPASRCSSVS